MITTCYDIKVGSFMQELNEMSVLQRKGDSCLDPKFSTYRKTADLKMQPHYEDIKIAYALLP